MDYEELEKLPPLKKALIRIAMKIDYLEGEIDEIRGRRKDISRENLLEEEIKEIITKIK